MKVTLYMLLTLAAGLVLILGAGLYVVAQFSAVYDPLEVYDYHVTQEEVMTAIDGVVKTEQSLHCKITDTTGTPERGFNYYLTLDQQKDNIQDEYRIKVSCINKRTFWNIFKKLPYSEIALIGVFDRTHNTGGYLPGKPGVSELTKNFEKDVVSRIRLKL